MSESDERQPRIALLLICLLALYLFHTWQAEAWHIRTWHTNTCSGATSNVSNSSAPADSSCALESIQNPYVAHAENEAAVPDRHAAMEEPVKEPLDDNDMAKSTHIDYSTKPVVAKVSMLYGQNPKPAYVRALRSHHVHNERFNYAMFVLTEDAMGGYWNKPLYLVSLIMQELAKPPADRLQWLM